jgi:hypothetical protein
MTNTKIEINCYHLFGNKLPEFARLPNITFHSDKIIIDFICHVFGCKLAIWPMQPRYNKSGNLDAFDEDLSLSNVWEEWNNSHNQNYIYECCFDRCGIFETNNAIVIPQNILLREMNRYLHILQLEESQYFQEIDKITETTGWLLTYLYEKNLFLFLARNTLTKETANIVSFLRKRNAVYGTVSVNSKNEIDGCGLFIDEWKETVMRLNKINQELRCLSERLEID